MRITIDTEARTLRREDGDPPSTLDLYSPEAFETLVRLWTRANWAMRYSYGFSWMGRPVIQLPEDLVRAQEAVYRVRPDVLIETGIAHGGSLVFYASLFKAMGAGRVIGVDVEIRPPNRRALEAHELAPMITLIEGSSIDPAVVERVRALVRPGERVMVVLDSSHTRAHVRAELEAYAPMVTAGSYVAVADAVMADLHDVPGGRAEWASDHPGEAVREFAAAHPEFTPAEPPPPFDERLARHTATYWPGGWLRRDG